MQMSVARGTSILVLVTLGFAGTGCSHSHRIQNQETPNSYKVDIGAKEVKEGERVRLFRTVCRDRSTVNRMNDTKICQEQALGAATVMEVLGQNSAVIRPDAGIEMTSDISIEKL